MANFGPILPGRWNERPELDPQKFAITQAGGGKYVARRRLPLRRPLPSRRPKPLAQAAPTDPYARDAPWARTYLDDLSRQEGHQVQVGKDVAAWLGNAITPLTAQATQVNQAFADAAKAGATPTPLMPAGFSDPLGYQTQADAKMGAETGLYGRQGASAQSAMDAGAIGALGQSLLASAGQQVRDIPALFAKQRTEYEDKVNQFLAQRNFEREQMAEDRRRWEAEQKASARARSFDERITLEGLGLDAAKLAMPNPPGGLAGPSSGPAPIGKQWVQRADGGWELVDDGTGGGGGGGGKRPPGTYTANELKKQGFRPVPKGAGGKWRDAATQADDGTLWIKPKGGAKTAGPSASSIAEWTTRAKTLLGGKYDAPSKSYINKSDPYDVFKLMVTSKLAPGQAYRILAATPGGAALHYDDVYDALQEAGYPEPKARRLTIAITKYDPVTNVVPGFETRGPNTVGPF